ncbi:MAG: LapA family protein [candidate division NC10 bacterium]
MTQLYLIFALLLALLVAIFAVQNAERVTIDFLVWTFQTSLVIVILVSAGVGALLAALISLPQTLTARRRLRESEKKLERLAVELGGSEEWGVPDEEE